MPGADDGGRSPTTVLFELLTEARALGFLGPGPLEPQIHHAEGFAAIARSLSTAESPNLVDLGAGGGLPGLVVATELPGVTLAPWRPTGGGLPSCGERSSVWAWPAG